MARVSSRLCCNKQSRPFHAGTVKGILKLREKIEKQGLRLRDVEERRK
jgi:hypothetical protein